MEPSQGSVPQSQNGPPVAVNLLCGSPALCFTHDTVGCGGHWQLNCQQERFQSRPPCPSCVSLQGLSALLCSPRCSRADSSHGHFILKSAALWLLNLKKKFTNVSKSLDCWCLLGREKEHYGVSGLHSPGSPSRRTCMSCFATVPSRALSSSFLAPGGM